MKSFPRSACGPIPQWVKYYHLLKGITMEKYGRHFVDWNKVCYHEAVQFSSVDSGCQLIPAVVCCLLCSVFLAAQKTAVTVHGPMCCHDAGPCYALECLGCCLGCHDVTLQRIWSAFAASLQLPFQPLLTLPAGLVYAAAPALAGTLITR